MHDIECVVRGLCVRVCVCHLRRTYFAAALDRRQCEWAMAMASYTINDHTANTSALFRNMGHVKKGETTIVLTEDGIPVRTLYFSNVYKNVSAPWMFMFHGSVFRK